MRRKDPDSHSVVSQLAVEALAAMRSLTKPRTPLKNAVAHNTRNSPPKRAHKELAMDSDYGTAEPNKRARTAGSAAVSEGVSRTKTLAKTPKVGSMAPHASSQKYKPPKALWKESAKGIEATAQPVVAVAHNTRKSSSKRPTASDHHERDPGGTMQIDLAEWR